MLKDTSKRPNVPSLDMFFNQGQKQPKGSPLTKVPVSWGATQLEILRQNKVVWIRAMSKELVVKIIESMGMLQHSLSFTLISPSNSEGVPVIDSTLVSLAKEVPPNESLGFHTTTYVVSGMLNHSDYLSLLEASAQKLEDQGYTVKRQIMQVLVDEDVETDSEFIVMPKPTYPKIVDVANFRNEIAEPAKYDPHPQSLIHWATLKQLED